IELENLNVRQKRNYPAIDLADFNNRVAFQITATSTLDKVKHTLMAFTNHKLYEHFDVLYVCIITESQQNYSQERLIQCIPDGFHFDVNQHIIDRESLIAKSANISSTPTLERISKLFEHEFSDIQIETRRQKFERGYLNNESEKIFPNMLEINFPKQFYT